MSHSPWYGRIQTHTCRQAQESEINLTTAFSSRKGDVSYLQVSSLQSRAGGGVQVPSGKFRPAGRPWPPSWHAHCRPYGGAQVGPAPPGQQVRAPQWPASLGPGPRSCQRPSRGGKCPPAAATAFTTGGFVDISVSSAQNRGFKQGTEISLRASESTIAPQGQPTGPAPATSSAGAAS